MKETGGQARIVHYQNEIQDEDLNSRAAQDRYSDRVPNWVEPEREVQVGVVEAVGSRRAAGPCVGAVDTCSGQSPAGGQTFAVVTRVELNAKVEAAGTLAFEAGGAAEAPMVHCCPQSLAAYAADDAFQKKVFWICRPPYAVRGVHIPGEPLGLRSCSIAAPGKVHRHTAGGRPVALVLAQGA